MKAFLSQKTHCSSIIVATTIGIISGTILGLVLNLWIFNSPTWLIVSALLIIISFRIGRVATLSLALAAGTIIGALRITTDIGDRTYIAQFIKQETKVSGIIYEDPEIDGTATTLRINNLIFGNATTQRPTTGSLFVKFYGSKKLTRSEKITLTGKISEGFGSFAGALYNPKLISSSSPDPPDLALQFRDNFANLVRQFIPAPEVDLSLGYLLGQRRSLPGTLTETLKIIGLTHIVVASGYNLSVLVGLSRRIFKRISRFAALFFGALLIITFMAITGFTPSMARAGIVSGLSLLAWFFGRKFHPAKLLLLVASTTLLLNPFYIQDLGWLLSFLSFIGVMIVSPILLAYFYPDTKPNLIARTITETTAAQICCLPLLIFFFGSFSLISIFANVLILPTIPVTMLLTSITGISALIPPVASTIGWLAGKLLSYHISVAEFFGKLDWALVTTEPENSLVLLTYPLIVCGLIYAVHKTKYRFIKSGVLE